MDEIYLCTACSFREEKSDEYVAVTRNFPSLVSFKLFHVQKVQYQSG